MSRQKIIRISWEILQRKSRAHIFHAPTNFWLSRKWRQIYTQQQTTDTAFVERDECLNGLKKWKNQRFHLHYIENRHSHTERERERVSEQACLCNKFITKVFHKSNKFFDCVFRRFSSFNSHEFI